MFTDKEKRIVLSMICRERKICKELDKEDNSIDSICLTALVDSIEYKIKHSKLWLGLDREV